MTSSFDFTVIIKTNKKWKNSKLNSVEIAIVCCRVHNLNNETWVASEYIFSTIIHSYGKILAYRSVTFMLLVLLLVLFTHLPHSKPECGGAVVILWSLFWRVFLHFSGLSSSVPLSNLLWINSNASFFWNSNCVIFNSPKYLIARYAFLSETAKINAKTQFDHLLVNVERKRSAKIGRASCISSFLHLK